MAIMLLSKVLLGFSLSMHIAFLIGNGAYASSVKLTTLLQERTNGKKFPLRNMYLTLVSLSTFSLVLGAVLSGYRDPRLMLPMFGLFLLRFTFVIREGFAEQLNPFYKQDLTYRLLEEPLNYLGVFIPLVLALS